MPDSSGRAEYHYVLVDYVCRVVKGALEAGDDVSRVRWVKRGDLGEYRLTEGTLAVIEKGFLRQFLPQSDARRKRSRI